MEVQDLSQYSEVDELLQNPNFKEVEEKLTDVNNTDRLESIEEQENEGNDATKLKPFRIESETPRLTDEDGWLDILGSDDLKKKVIESGCGTDTRPQRGDWVVINATGKLENGTIVEKYIDKAIIVGDSDIVQGLDLSITLMEKGELAEVIVPARLAYGEHGKLPEIPSNSILYYEIRLVNVTSGDDINLNIEQRIQIGDEKRERGNFWYSHGEFSTAVHCYRKALDILDDDNQNTQDSSAEFEKLLNIRIKVYNNLAAAQLKIEAYEAAIKSVNNVLMIEPKNVKALFRKGKIFAAQGNLDGAINVLKQALKIEPETKIIHLELSKLTLRRKQEDNQAKAMYKRMFKCDVQPQIRSKTKKHWISNWSMVIGGIFTIVCGIAIYKHFNSTE